MGRRPTALFCQVYSVVSIEIGTEFMLLFLVLYYSLWAFFSWFCCSWVCVCVFMSLALRNSLDRGKMKAPMGLSCVLYWQPWLDRVFIFHFLVCVLIVSGLGQGGERSLLFSLRWCVAQPLLHLLLAFSHCITASLCHGVSAMCSEWENLTSPRLEKSQATQQVLMFPGNDFFMSNW